MKAENKKRNRMRDVHYLAMIFCAGDVSPKDFAAMVYDMEPVKTFRPLSEMPHFDLCPSAPDASQMVEEWVYEASRKFALGLTCAENFLWEISQCQLAFEDINDNADLMNAE